MSTARSTGRAPSSRPTSSAPSTCSRPCAAYWRGLDDEAQAGFRFLHVSTDEVYGSLGDDGRLHRGDAATRRTRPTPPRKAAADHLVRAYHHTYGLPALITNCSNNYGPYQFPEKLIPLMILNALEGKPLPIYGDGGNVRDWLYVEDHCRAIWRVLRARRAGRDLQRRRQQREDQPGGRRHAVRAARTSCVPDSPHRPHARAEDLRRRPPGPRPALRDRRQQDARASSAGSRQETFESGMRRTVQWYLDNRDWCEAREGRQLQGASGWASRRGDKRDEGHHPGRRRRHPAAPGHACDQQAAAAGLRQADDLLPAVDADAGGHPRDPGHHHAARQAAVRATARRRQPVGHPDRVRGPGAPRRARAGLSDRAGVRRRRTLLPGARRQHLLRPGLEQAVAQRRGKDRGARRSSATGCGPRALRRGGVRRAGPGDQPRGKAGQAEVELRGHRAVLLRQPGLSTWPRSWSPRRGASSRSPTSTASICSAACSS